MRKFTKRAVSLAVASFVTVASVFTVSTINANVATTSILATTNKNDTYKVTFTTPSDWTGTVGTEVKDSKCENADNTTTVTHYYECTTEAQLPLDGESSFVVDSDADISSTGVITKVTNEPIAAPTVTPVNRPQVTVSEANGTSYYEETNDSLSVVVDLAEGATSATYSVDNGPETTITDKTIVKLGEGKIANSEISLKITSTDGTTTNTQKFTYYKKSKVSETATKTSTKSVSASMVSLFNTVKTLASATVNKSLPVHFKIPTSDWEGSDRTVYCYAYYDVTTSNGTKTIKPLGIWPGTAIKKSREYYDITIPTTVGSVKVMFSCVIGGKGQHYCKGDLLPDNTRCSEEHYSCNVLYKLPYGYSGQDEYGNSIPYDGLQITDEAWITVDGYDTNNLYIAGTSTVTPIPSTASPTPTATTTTADAGKETPDPSATATAPVSTELDGYFGASLSAPQYNTTAQTLSAVALNATGDVTYAFSVDGEEIYEGSKSILDWTPSDLTEGTHVISAKITDSKGNVWTETKNYTISVDGTVEPTATPEVTVVPTVLPTATPEVTVVPTVLPTATPKVTVVPTVVPTTVPTVAPTATPTESPTTITLEKNAITQGIGEKVKVKIKTNPKSEVSIRSKNKKIATVTKKNYIKGIGKGNTKIIVTAGTAQATINVTVCPAPIKIGVTSTLASSTSCVLKKGTTSQIPIYFNKGAYSNKITFRSSKKSVASVSLKGKITAKKVGKTTIRISSFNNKKATVKVKVTQ